VKLEAEPSASSAPGPSCELPEGRPVRWTRSRVVVHRPGRIATTASTSVDAIRLPGLSRVTGANVQDSHATRLDLEGNRTLSTIAQIGGRCLLRPAEGDPVWSVPCPTREIAITTPVEQTWWVEIACAKGEGWFSVDESAFTVEHFPGEVTR